MKQKLLFYDLETVGTDYWRHSIHQLSGAIVIDGEVKERFDLKIRPHESSIVDDTALKVCNVTLEEIRAYPHRTEQFEAFLAIIKRYIDPYDPTDKFFLAGYNNSGFDDKFLRTWFTLENNDYFGTWFWSNPIDVFVMAGQYLLPVRHLMPSFKLSRVSKYLGIDVQDDLLHNSQYDITLTMRIYDIVKGHQIQVDDWTNS